MIDIALNRKEELIKKFRNTWFDEKYKYYHNANFTEDLGLAESTWNNHQFVSINKSGEIIGYIGYHIDRSCDFVCGLCIINFSDDKLTFGMDTGKVLKYIFEKFNFRKLEFEVVVGNPIEKTYDKMIEKYGGRIVGVRKKQTKLIDGFFYDEKLYEILREDYITKRGADIECK